MAGDDRWGLLLEQAKRRVADDASRDAAATDRETRTHRVEADRSRRQALANRRSEISAGEDVAAGAMRGLGKTGTSAARGVGWLTEKLTGGRRGQGITNWADEAERQLEEYTGVRYGDERFDPGTAGTVGEVAGRLAGETATLVAGGGAVRGGLRALSKAPLPVGIPEAAGAVTRTLDKWGKGGAVARTAASGAPFLPMDIIQGAGSAMPDEEGNPRGFVLPGRGGAAVENVLMGNVPMLGIEAGVSAYRGAKSAKAFEEALAAAEQRAAPYRWAKQRNVAETRPSRLLAERSEPFPTTSGERQGPGLAMPEVGFVSRETPETRPERLLGAPREPIPTAGIEPVGPAIPSRAVAPDIEEMFGVVPPERRLARGPLITPPPVDPMEAALDYTFARQVERSANRTGAARVPVVSALGGAAAGAAGGGMVGDTPEERRRNALLGAVAGGAGAWMVGRRMDRSGPGGPRRPRIGAVGDLQREGPFTAAHQLEMGKVRAAETAPREAPDLLPAMEREKVPESSMTPRVGAVEPAVVSTVSGAGVGGYAGSKVGDTEEERKRNAVAGMVAGAAAGAGAARVVSGASRAASKASTPALAKAATMVAAGERGVSKGATFLTNAEKAYTDIVDEAFPLSKFGREYDVTNPERLAETVAQGQGWRGQARLHVGEKVKPILQRIKGREADVQGYVVAKREQQLRAQGASPKTAMTDAEIAAAVRDGDADPVLVQAQQDLTGAYRDLLTMRRDVGLLTQDQYDAILQSEDFYTPFTREWGGETAAGGGNSAGKFVNRGSGVRKMDRAQIANAQITDPLERLVLDAADTYRQVAKQKVTNVVGEIVGQHQGGVPGLLREVPAGDTPKPTARIVEPMVGGSRKRYEVTDPDFYDAWASFDPRTMGIAEKIGAFFKRTLQAGVTLLPDFAIANLARDTGGAAIQQPVRKLLKRAGAGAAVGAVAGAATADEDESTFLAALKGAGFGSGAAAVGPQVIKALGAAKSIITNDATYKEFLRSGGSTEMGFYPRNVEDARKVLKELRRNGVEATDIINPARWKDALFYIGNVAEQSTRVAKFAEMKRTGASGAEAALGAQDVSLRFANIGKRTKGVASVTPFWNAGVQGWDKLTRMIKDPRTAAAGIATITAPTMALWAVNKDDTRPDGYWSIPQWERNMFWLIPKEEGGFYRIAKPFQIGFLFGSLPERLADFAYQKAQGNDANPGETFRAAALDMASTTVDGTMPVPTVLGVAAEQGANYDFFRNRPIVTRPELPRSMQQDERTSFVAKTAGEALDLSPQRIDHAIRSLTGSAGTVASSVIDAAARRVGLDERADPSPGVPILARRFVTNDAGTTDQEQTVRRRWADAERVYRGARQLESEVTKAGGDPSKLKAYVDKHRTELLARKELEGVIKGLNEISDRRKALKKDRRIDAATRKEQLQVLRLLGQELAQRGLAPTTTTTARAVP